MYIKFSTGLTLELNIEQYEYVSLLSQEAGIRVFVSTQNEMPFPYELGISAAPGYSTSIQLRKVHALMNSKLPSFLITKPTSSLSDCFFLVFFLFVFFSLFSRFFNHQTEKQTE